jgi:hypothetical protein
VENAILPFLPGNADEAGDAVATSPTSVIPVIATMAIDRLITNTPLSNTSRVPSVQGLEPGRETVSGL